MEVKNMKGCPGNFLFTRVKVFSLEFLPPNENLIKIESFVRDPA